MSLRPILLLNLIGLLLLLSWWQTLAPFWPALNAWVFHAFNQTLTADNLGWVNLVAALNTRTFDAISFLVMVAVLLLAVSRDQREGRLWHWFGVGFVMLFSAGVIALINNELPYGHPSPTLYFQSLGEPVNLTTQLVNFSTKDTAGNSFPGDHGMMLMVFAAFMMRFADRPCAILAAAMIPLFSLPRIIAGGHWLEDVFMGSLSISLLLLPWLLLTPLAPGAVAAIERLASRLDLPFSR
ncbi:phosphatase PAP2 family protein [Halotalea alkalilenta]|uniref:Phosphatidic acid phosphatase type 2/haloperoxidase domain-containing protein n=1 Tax=Halotalea alkalilenta TaxID=376489 RepID=A0A172YIP4_9GAMM|nr:phosphatase PAP2 family protein [Halotalea alkalilenta]ANF59073.1 hypothetical protein A5892_17715 [Halotalea alkalilenta]